MEGNKGESFWSQLLSNTAFVPIQVVDVSGGGGATAADDNAVFNFSF